MTIRGRVDVYCTDSEATFIAVASSTELNASGQPAVVRIVEFMATDPLYKATQIGDFGDFDFRATELHDGIMTLLQVQHLWNQIPEDARWWPVEPFGSIPFRAADLIYATLGPMATNKLLQALLSSSDKESESNERLIEGLRDAVGRRPAMLVALAASIGAAQRYEIHRFDEQEVQRNESGVDRLLGESLKHLGGLVLEAAQQFGLDEDQFGPWFESQMYDLFDQSQWPPTQVPYTIEVPPSPESQVDWQVEILELLRGPFSDDPDSEANPPVSLERYDIYIQLAAEAGNHLKLIGKDVPIAPESARAWARLVSATVQTWHHRLADTENRVPKAYDDTRFTWDLLEAISSLPRSTWEGLSNARRICFVADLGELLMLICETTSGVISEIGATAILDACNGDDDLLAIAIDAAYKIPFQNGRWEFDWAIQAVRERHLP